MAKEVISPGGKPNYIVFWSGHVDQPSKHLCLYLQIVLFLSCIRKEFLSQKLMKVVNVDIQP